MRPNGGPQAWFLGFHGIGRVSPGRGDYSELAGVCAVICPTCRFSEFMSSPISKNFSLATSGKSLVLICASRPHEGRFAIVTKRGWGCGGRKRQRRTSAADADGETAWSCPPDAGVKFAMMIAGDGGYKARYTGESAL